MSSEPAYEPRFDFPAGHEPARAVVYVRNVRAIAAPAALIWEQLVAAPAWPQWYRRCRNVQLPAGEHALHAGSVFRWTTQGIGLRTDVRVFEPRRQLGWFAASPLLAAYHVWDLHEIGGTTIVTTDETQRGLLPSLFGWIIRPMMIRAHDEWLAGLAQRVDDIVSARGGQAAE